MSKTVGISDDIHAHIKAKAQYEKRSMKSVATEALLEQFNKNFESNTYGSGTFG